MSLLVWVMIGIAIWHFAIFFPDRFWGGIVGAFLAAIAGAVLVALIINGFNVPGRHDTHLVQAFEAIQGQSSPSWPSTSTATASSRSARRSDRRPLDTARVMSREAPQ